MLFLRESIAVAYGLSLLYFARVFASRPLEDDDDDEDDDEDDEDDEEDDDERLRVVLAVVVAASSSSSLANARWTDSEVLARSLFKRSNSSRCLFSL